MIAFLSAPSRRRCVVPRLARAVAALLALALSAWPGPAAAQSGDRVRIAAGRAPLSLPLYVAQRRGFFADEHLHVVLADCSGGMRCLRELLDGRADLATSSEMPVVLHAFGHDDVAIIATMVHASDNLKLIARKTSGVTSAEQLTGHRVGVISGTAAQYLLELHLLTVGVDPRRVTMVPLQAEDTLPALESSRIDAVAVWEPFGYAALNGADAVGLRLPLSGGYIESFNLMTRRAAGAPRDELLVRVLRAVDRAEQFIHARPAEAQAILREQLNLDQSFVDWVWGGLGFRLSLEQALVSTMEGETRWAQREGHAPAGARPNVLSLIHAAPLKAVRPSAVGTGG